MTGVSAGSIFAFQFAHRGRSGVDMMQFSITDLGVDNILGGGDDSVLFSSNYSDGTAGWGFYTGESRAALGNTV